MMFISRIAMATTAPVASLQKVPVTDISDILLTLLFVVALILVCGWVVKRWMNGQTGGIANNSQMKVLAILPLGTRERMAIVQVGDQQLVIGITASSINTLHVLENPIEVNHPQAMSKFQKKLAEILKGNVNNKKEASE
jgi:flagellar protein FliO/FliZ